MPLDLGKKIGPLPAWGWGALGTGVGGTWLYIKRKNAAKNATAADAQNVGASPSPYTGGGSDVPDQLPPGVGAYLQGPPGARGPAGPRGPRGLNAPKPKVKHTKHPKPAPKAHPHAMLVKNRYVSEVPRTSSTSTTAHPSYVAALAYPPTQTRPAATPIPKRV